MKFGYLVATTIAVATLWPQLSAAESIKLSCKFKQDDAPSSLVIVNLDTSSATHSDDVIYWTKITDTRILMGTNVARSHWYEIDRTTGRYSFAFIGSRGGRSEGNDGTCTPLRQKF